MLRDARGQSLLASLGLLALVFAIEPARGYFLEVGVLGDGLAGDRYGIEFARHTSVPNLFLTLSPRILFAMNLATNDMLASAV